MLDYHVQRTAIERVDGPSDNACGKHLPVGAYQLAGVVVGNHRHQGVQCFVFHEESSILQNTKKQT